MKNAKFVAALFLTLMAVARLSAQVDLKIQPIGLLFKNVGVAAEFGLKENVGLEATAGVDWDDLSLIVGSSDEENFSSRKIRLGGNLRYYFNTSDKRLDRFYAGVYSRYAGGKWTSDVDDSEVTSTRLSAGFLFGTKVVARNERLLFDFGIGFGRAFVYEFDSDEGNVDLDDIPFVNWDIPIYLSIGYRF